VVIGLIGGIFVLILVFTITNVRSNKFKNKMEETEKKIGKWERIEDDFYSSSLIYYIQSYFLLINLKNELKSNFDTIEYKTITSIHLIKMTHLNYR
jgi:hypothetical protein